MRTYPVFLSRKIPEFTGDDRLADKFGKLVLVVDILVLFLYAENGGLSPGSDRRGRGRVP